MLPDKRTHANLARALALLSGEVAGMRNSFTLENIGLDHEPGHRPSK